MKRYGFYIFAVCLSSLGACNNSQQLTPEEHRQVLTECRDMLQNYADAVRDSGLMAEFPYLDDSWDFSWVPPGYTTAISYDSVASILRKNAPLFQKMDNSYEELRITPLSKTKANYYAIIKSISTDTAGVVSEVRLNENGMLSKKNGRWKLAGGETSVIE